MEDSRLRKKVIFLISVSLMLLTVVSADLKLDTYEDAEVDLLVEDESLSDIELDGSAECSDSGNVELETPSGTNEVLDVGDFNKQLKSDYGFGEYSLVMNCNDTEKSINFTLNYIDVEDDSLSYDKDLIYHKDDQQVNLGLDFRGDKEKFDPEQDLELTQNNLDDSKIKDLKFVDGSPDSVSYQFYLSDDQEPGDVTPVWDLDAGDKTIEVRQQQTFELRQPWDVSIPENYIEGKNSYMDLQENNGDLMVLNADYRGEKFNFRSGDFRFEIMDKNESVIYSKDSIPIESVENGYLLSLNEFPDLELGEYSFRVEITENEKYRVGDFSVLNYIDFRGTIENADENPVEADFRISQEGQEWTEFSTDNGKYTEPVLPDNYNMSILFDDKVSMDLDEVKFRNRGDKRIMYDRIPTKSLEDIEGVTVIKGIGTLFSYEFEEGQITIGYDFGDVEANNARIIKCEGWPMSPSRQCRGDWEVVNNSKVSVDPTVPQASFPVKPEKHQDSEFLMKAYALVKNTNLNLNMDLEDMRVPVEEEISIEGEVETDQGESIGDVDVKVELLKDEKEVLTTTESSTNSNGAFGVSISAPEETGVYDVRITADKEPHNGFEVVESNKIETFISKDIDVEGPDQVEFKTGQSNTAEYLVVNTGQANLEDLRFRVSNLNNDWYEVSKESWNELGAGSSERVTLNATIPEDYFDEENMENVKFEVEARGVHSGGEINSLKNTVATITNEYMYSKQSNESTEAGGQEGLSVPSPNLPDNPTGQFLEEASTFNGLLGFVIVFTLILATAIKKKSNERDGMDRSNRLGGMNGSMKSSMNGSKTGTALPPSRSSNDSEENSRESRSSDNQDGEDEIDQVAKAIMQSEKDQDKDKEIQDDRNDVHKEDSDSTKCSVCGEEFDTVTGRKMHEKAIHN